MAITIRDNKNEIPATYYIQVQKDLESKGVTHAEMRPGAEDVVWVSKGPVPGRCRFTMCFARGRLRRLISTK